MRFTVGTLLFITFLAALGMGAIGLVYRHAPDRFLLVVGLAAYCLFMMLMMVLPHIGTNLFRGRLGRRKISEPEPSEKGIAKSNEVPANPRL